MPKFLPAVLILFALTAKAQSDGFPVVADDLTTIPGDSAIKTINRAMHILREFRIQAYVQVEWQRADSNSYYVNGGPSGTNGLGLYSGGTFPANGNNRFLVRRGRFKLSFEHQNARNLKVIDFAFQFDATERSFTVKDFYGRVIDPWIGWFSIQGGIFLRPFGFETPASPAFHESPEFSRVNQTILPNEVELGEAIVIESPAKFQTVYLRLDANLVNGEGVGNGSQTGAYESRKDFIGRIKVGKMWELGKSRLGFNASVSYYNGGVLQSTPYVYQLTKDSTGAYFYQNIGLPSGELKKVWKREYAGAHLELKADYPIGITTLRGEFIAGTEPSGNTTISSSVPLGPGNGAPLSDLYLRKFNGAMFYLTQSFKTRLKTHVMMHDITIKYDWYDPQSQISGKDLIFTRGFAVTDMKWTTIGIGYSFIPYNWFKLMVWYDFVKNEATAIPGWRSDYKGDNMLTIRTQFYIDTWWFNPKSKYADNLMLKKY